VRPSERDIFLIRAARFLTEAEKSTDNSSAWSRSVRATRNTQFFPCSVGRGRRRWWHRLHNVYMMQMETNKEKREAWIASLDAIAALEPKIVVAGHKRAGSSDLPDHISATQQYLRDFTWIASERDTVEDLVAGMMELLGDRDNPCTL